jgi:hypothetical protein
MILYILFFAIILMAQNHSKRINSNYKKNSHDR